MGEEVGGRGGTMNDEIRLLSNERYCLVIPLETCDDCRDLLSSGDRTKCEKLNLNVR